MTLFGTIAILGAGAWGTALANAFARPDRRVLLWGRDGDLIAELARTRANARYLPDVALADTVVPTASLADIAQARAVYLATPAQTTRGIGEALALALRPGTPLVITAKGIERASGFYPSEVISDLLPGTPVAVLSGPSFATDVARGLPTAVALACADAVIAQALAEAFSGPALRLYHTTDVRGVEIGGAAKNVLAIAAGIVAGRGLGESAKAALIARGFAELMRLARACGAQPETLMGLSGLGDLVLTCGSAKSRNFAFGQALGKGSDVAVASGGKLVEGAATAAVLIETARARGVEMPICEAVDAVIAGRISIDAVLAGLMARPIKAEQD